MDIIKHISRELGSGTASVAAVVELMAEGATVPFIARYRKERTGDLDETKIREIARRHAYFTELDERRETVLDSIRSQGKLTPELEAKIVATASKTELEDLYLPYKPKRVTRASKARDAGLEPLARWLEGLEDPRADLAAKAAEFVAPDKGYETPDKALRGACDILAEEAADDADVRKRLRELAAREGILRASVRKEFAEQKTKYDMYRDHRERAADVPSHRFLAMLRGEKDKVLRLELEFPQDKALACVEGRLVRHPKSAAAALLRRDGRRRPRPPARPRDRDRGPPGDEGQGRRRGLQGLRRQPPRPASRAAGRTAPRPGRRSRLPHGLQARRRRPDRPVPRIPGDLPP